MTIKNLKDELALFDDDQPIVFKVADRLPAEITITEEGFIMVDINAKMKLTYIGREDEAIYIEFELEA